MLRRTCKSLMVRTINGPARAGRVPKLLLRAKRGEAGLSDDVVDERGDASQLNVRRLAKLTEVRKAAVDLLGVLVRFAPHVVRTWRRASRVVVSDASRRTDLVEARANETWVSRSEEEDELAIYLQS